MIPILPIAIEWKITIHNLVKLTPSVSPTASHLPQRGRQYPAPSLRELSAKLTEGVLKLTEGVLKLWIVNGKYIQLLEQNTKPVSLSRGN